jgi:ferrous iron transport protein A
VLLRLSDLKPGQIGTVVRVEGEKPVRRRMMDMGIVRGADVLVKRVAPLGDPIEFVVRSYSLSLRRTEAQAVEVEMTPSRSGQSQ